MEIHAHVPKLGKTPVHWLLEGLFIVVSVLLAFAVGEFREARANRELTARVLTGIKAEMEHNLATLEPFVPMHTRWLEALQKADSSTGSQAGLDVWFATRPPLPLDGKSPFPFLRRSAWDAAISGGRCLQSAGTGDRQCGAVGRRGSVFDDYVRPGQPRRFGSPAVADLG